MGAIGCCCLLLLGLIGCTFSYPALQDQDYLEYLAQIAASKGKSMLHGDLDAFEILYDTDKQFSPQQRSQAMQVIEQQMMDKQPQYYDEQLEEDDEGDDEGEVEEQPGTFSGKLVKIDDWPAEPQELGQVGGVAVCPEGFPHAFHRAGRKWEADSFADDNTYAKQAEGPIPEATILTINGTNGAILEAWGENQFYMPHGLTIDSQGNLWLTDVALHQVFKYSPQKELLLTLGEAFVPAMSNDDPGHFCKPTDVAVLSNGDFFVADGYCNSRIMKFSAEGELLGTFGVDDFFVPHSLALLEDYGKLCVADRENSRILCYDAGLEDPELLGKPIREYNEEAITGKVYAIAYSPNDGLLYGVGTGEDIPQGFTIDVAEEQGYYTDIISTWSPADEGFSIPHALAVSPDGEDIYVGEVGPKQKNLWKFMKAVEVDGEHEEVEEENKAQEVEDEEDPEVEEEEEQEEEEVEDEEEEEDEEKEKEEKQEEEVKEDTEKEDKEE